MIDPANPPLPQGDQKPDPADKAWADFAASILRIDDAAGKLQTAAAKLSAGDTWQAKFERFLAAYTGKNVGQVIDPKTLQPRTIRTADEYREYVSRGGRPEEQATTPASGATPTRPQSPLASIRDADALRKAIEEAKREAGQAISDVVRQAVAGVTRVTEARASGPKVAALIRDADRERRGEADTYGVRPPEARPGEKVTEISDRYGVRPVEGRRPESEATPRPSLVSRAAEFLKGGTFGAASGVAPATGGGLGGGFAGLAALAGRAHVAAAVLMQLVDSGRKLVNEQESNARRLAQFSPSIAALIAQLDANRMIRTLQRGERTASSTGGFTQSLDRFEKALLPVQTALDSIKNTAATGLLSAATRLVQVLEPLASKINYFLEGKDPGAPELFGEFAAGVAREHQEGRINAENARARMRDALDAHRGNPW